LFTVTIETADGATGGDGGFALAAGERKTGLDISVERDGTVRGRLVDRATGKPAIGVVLWFGAGHDSGAVDGDGRFEAHLPAKRYEQIGIQNETGGYPIIQRPFTVRSGETTDLGDVLVDLKEE
jgi:hypothetical protein